MHPRQNTLKKSALSIVFLIESRRQADVGCKNVFGRESLVNAKQPDHAQTQESGKRQQESSQADFKPDQRGTEPSRSSTIGCCSSAGRYRVLWIRPRKSPSGEYAKGDSGQHGNDCRKPHHPRIDPDFVNPWKIGGSCGNEQPYSVIGESNSRNPAKYSQQRAFGQHLPYQPRARSSKRGANAGFAQPARNSYKQKIREIQTND